MRNLFTVRDVQENSPRGDQEADQGVSAGQGHQVMVPPADPQFFGRQNGNNN